MTYLIAGWISPGTCPNDVEKKKISAITGLELHALGLKTRRQSLYRMNNKITTSFLSARRMASQTCYLDELAISYGDGNIISRLSLQVVIKMECFLVVSS
jgi:predicted membrane protein